jgi:hypothetical protein
LASSSGTAAVLEDEVRQWSSRSYEDVAAQPKLTAYERERDGVVYQVEVEILVRRPEWIQLMIAVDDCTLRSAFSPATEIVIVHRDP